MIIRQSFTRLSFSKLSSLRRITTMTPPGVKINPLLRSSYPAKIVIDPSDLRRQDESPDTLWYETPRFVQHIDDGAISTLQIYYTHNIPPHSRILDLCSSWTSHLPSPSLLQAKSVHGIGLNAQEMERNAQLTSFQVLDLNSGSGDGGGKGGVTFEVDGKKVRDGEVDVVICNVSVDYLVRPLEVFGEIWRVLSPGGTAHCTFSNRCFPTKVINKWVHLSDAERRHWVGQYFWGSGGSSEEGGLEAVEEVVLKEGKRGFMGVGGEDPVFVVRGRKKD